MGTTVDSRYRNPQSDLRQLAGRPVLKIARYDLMEPFLMTLVSDSDLWMYVSSLGSLTAGRIDEDHSLFPYAVEDMVHRTAGRTGPFTSFRIWRSEGAFEIWEPFAGMAPPEGAVRNLYKSVLGNIIVFEEKNEPLGLTFRYRWASSDAVGFIRTSEIVNEGVDAITVDVVDGLLNLIPAGISYRLLQGMSVLPDAYTECEVDSATGLAIISLASLIVDKPEPGESLTASVAWNKGLENSRVLLSTDQLTAYRRGEHVRAESTMRGRRSSYLVSASLELAPGARQSWDIVTDTGRSQAQVEALKATLLVDPDARLALQASIELSAENLEKYVAAADGQPCSADDRADRHHQACVLFNIMRGGIYAAGDTILTSDFRNFMTTRNRGRAQKHRGWLARLPESISYSDLLAQATAKGDADLTRIAYEYLPLTFSRRHGDPSRPWNRFSIRLKNPDGSPLLAYEGNWRDIFQNWEALSLSYPMFVESIIAKFVNASTVDGFNPYRIMREGIEWEVPNPSDPWSALGYWGDHQIIYLLKFLELAEQIRPNGLDALLDRRIFTYANVPLRLRPYDQMVRDPQATIDFDGELNDRIEKSVRSAGTDAKLLTGADGETVHVSLAEKLLVPALSKLSNLVLDAGIWMNTQRPEWNDANNALVGNGVSMVTLCYLRRYLVFCRSVFGRQSGSIAISTEVLNWLHGIVRVLEGRRSILDSAQVSGSDRRILLDELGRLFSDYRESVYSNGFAGQANLAWGDAERLCEAAIPFLDHSIRAAKREDGLYHAYCLIDLREEGKAHVTPLHEMLEGQVAVLSAGCLKPAEVGELVQALFDSKMYRPDRETFMLYPDRRLPGFLEKNVIPSNAVLQNPLLKALAEAGDARVLAQDAGGKYRFSSGLRNASVLSEVLRDLGKEPQWTELVEWHRHATLEAYESVFGHRFFTGRSGAMYGYEGLGSIYWHMVSKLLVAVQEAFFEADRNNAPAADLQRIACGYYRLRSGMGFNKSAHEFGAFPSDPYSHTPAGRGAKQPGMTGQSKEDILSRWMEYGVFFAHGLLQFRPSLLRREEFHKEPVVWTVRDQAGNLTELDLPANSLGFTVCGVPVVYRLTEGQPETIVALTNGIELTIPGSQLSADLSQSIYARSGKIARITVLLTRSQILAA